MRKAQIAAEDAETLLKREYKHKVEAVELEMRNAYAHRFAELRTEYTPKIDAVTRATNHVHAERVANAKPAFPVGTVMVLWEYVHRPQRTDTFRFRPSNTRAVVEVITPTSVHPATVAEWRRAGMVGAVVLRDLTSSGVPGKRYTFDYSLGNYEASLWAPVGVDYNDIRCAAAIAASAAEAAKKAADNAAVLGAACDVFGMSK